MKKPIFAIVGMLLAVAGCSGGSSNSSAQSGAQASSAAAPESAAPSSGEAAASDLPVYPDATLVPLLSMSRTRCGHKTTSTTYWVKDDLKTVSDWYAQRLPGDVRVDGNQPMTGGTSIEITEFFDPNGTRMVGVAKTHFGADVPASAQNIMNASAVHVILATVEPGFSASELKDAEAVIGSDAAERQRVMAKTTCDK